MSRNLKLRIAATDVRQHRQLARPHKGIAFSAGTFLLAVVLMGLALISGYVASQLPSHLNLEHRWVKRFCAQVSCSWLQSPLPYHAVQLQDMRLMQRGDKLFFEGQLVNKARTLPWPTLHLSLYGLDAKRRQSYRLTPKDYLYNDAPLQMEPKAHVVRFLVDSDSAAVSYAIEVKPTFQS